MERSEKGDRYRMRKLATSMIPQVPIYEESKFEISTSSNSTSQSPTTRPLPLMEGRPLKSEVTMTKFKCFLVQTFVPHRAVSSQTQLKLQNKVKSSSTFSNDKSSLAREVIFEDCNIQMDPFSEEVSGTCDSRKVKKKSLFLRCCGSTSALCSLSEVTGCLFGGLIMSCLIAGAILVGLGRQLAQQSSLAAGAILMIVALGLLIHHCFSKTGSTPPKMTNVLVIETTDPLACQMEVRTKLSLNQQDNVEERRKEHRKSSYKLNSDILLAQQRGTTLPAALRRQLFIQRSQSANVPQKLPLPSALCKKSYRSSSVLDLARSISTAAHKASDCSQVDSGWNRSRPCHKFIRRCSYPWNMARPERHYIED